MQEIAERKEWVELFETAERQIEDAATLIEMAEETGDESMAGDVDEEVTAAYKTIGDMELKNTLSGPDDDRNAIMHINAGAGGTEAQDWAEMLMRMYTRWAEKTGFKVALVDEQIGDVAGMKSVTLEM